MIPHELPKLPQAMMYLKSALWGFDDLLMKKLSGSWLPFVPRQELSVRQSEFREQLVSGNAPVVPGVTMCDKSEWRLCR